MKKKNGSVFVRTMRSVHLFYMYIDYVDKSVYILQQFNSLTGRVLILNSFQTIHSYTKMTLKTLIWTLVSPNRVYSCMTEVHVYMNMDLPLPHFVRFYGGRNLIRIRSLIRSWARVYPRSNLNENIEAVTESLWVIDSWITCILTWL